MSVYEVSFRIKKCQMKSFRTSRTCEKGIGSSPKFRHPTGAYMFNLICYSENCSSFRNCKRRQRAPFLGASGTLFKNGKTSADVPRWLKCRTKMRTTDLRARRSQVKIKTPENLARIGGINRIGMQTAGFAILVNEKVEDEEYVRLLFGFEDRRCEKACFEQYLPYNMFVSSSAER